MMSINQFMDDRLVGKRLRHADTPSRHSDPSTSFEDLVRDDHDNEIEIEEIEEKDFEHASGIKVLRPDEYEEPPDLCLQESDPTSRTSTPPDLTAQHDYLVQGFRSLHCDDNKKEEGSQGWLRNNQHQWTMGIRKRSHSQSAGCDPEIRYAEPLGDHALGDSVRRLRRRVRDRSNQNSRIIEGAQAINTVEIEEAEDDIQVLPATLHDCSGALEAEAIMKPEDVMDMD